MAPKEGYENLAVELAHDMGTMEERMAHQGEMQKQQGAMLTEISRKLNGHEDHTAESSLKLSRISEQLDGFTGHCATHRTEILDIVDRKIKPLANSTARVTRAVAPAEIVKAFRSNSLFKIVIALAATIVVSFAGWVGYTHNLADHNEDRVIRVEEALEPLKKLPAQMRVQERKIDRVLDRLMNRKKHGGS